MHGEDYPSGITGGDSDVGESIGSVANGGEAEPVSPGRDAREHEPAFDAAGGREQRVHEEDAGALEPRAGLAVPDLARDCAAGRLRGEGLADQQQRKQRPARRAPECQHAREPAGHGATASARPRRW